MKFSTIVRRKSCPVITDVELAGIKMYQNELINFMIYSDKSSKQAITMNSAIVQEIRECERWLKINTESFMNDNNKKFNQ
jgi:hypothetical protein